MEYCPGRQPKTKPKALNNYGLIHARGEYVAIYDAEDNPEPDQLKRVLVAFSKTARNVSCIQAKLNYYKQATELIDPLVYHRIFDVVDLSLPFGMPQALPIPLGGTSNHFKKEALIESGAWILYVTEDADLGINAYIKRGYKTASLTAQL